MRQYLLTASILVGLLLSACAESPQNDAEALSSPETSSAASAPTTQDMGDAKIQTAPSLKSKDETAEAQSLPERFQGLDPNDISRAEIDELIALQKKQNQSRQEYQKELKSWREQDPSTRGERPPRKPSPLSQDQRSRLRTLNNKMQIANIGNKYQNIDPKVLSEAEIKELITLEREQTKQLQIYQDKLVAWQKQDPTTRGAQPKMDEVMLLGGDARLQDLQGKIRNFDEIRRLKERIEKLSATHNVSLSDSEISELTELQTEQQKFESEFAKAMTGLEKENHFNGGKIDPDAAIAAIPKHHIQRMLDAEIRIQAIKSPIEAAEKADIVHEKMMKLSEESGVPILSGEIAETIALSAEKERIKEATITRAIQKWLTEGGPIDQGEPLPNDEDYARLKEIDARLKSISSPMNDAKNAALEAVDPARRQARLKREQQKKWKIDWQDRKQAGEIPLGAELIAPSYFELQDRVEDYRTKIKSRANKVGYYLSEIELNRLDELNDEMVDIRKHVHEMELDGSSTVKGEYGQKSQSFGVTAGMYKIELIEGKQRRMLAELIEAEAAENRTQQSDVNETGTQTLHQRNHGLYGGVNASRAETIIESFRASGIEVPQSEADDLLDFVRDFKDRD